MHERYRFQQNTSMEKLTSMVDVFIEVTNENEFGKLKRNEIAAGRICL